MHVSSLTDNYSVKMATTGYLPCLFVTSESYYSVERVSLLTIKSSVVCTSIAKLLVHL